MYATGIIKAKLKNVKDAIIIPKSAVLWTGKRAVVYVKVPHEKTISFVYREIILGQDMGAFYIVKNGLEPDEEVATNGVFRIDASAQLLGQKSMMNPTGAKGNTVGMANMPDMNIGDDNAKVSKVNDEDMSNMVMIDKSKIDKVFKRQLGKVVTEYINLKDAFTDDNSSLAQKEAKNVQNSLKKVNMLLLQGDEHNAWMKAYKPIEEALSNISNSKKIGRQRDAFLTLSKNLSEAIKMLGIETENGKPLYLVFCPMANNNKGGYWLSYEKNIKNPYYGKKNANLW